MTLIDNEEFLPFIKCQICEMQTEIATIDLESKTSIREQQSVTEQIYKKEKSKVNKQDKVDKAKDVLQQLYKRQMKLARCNICPKNQGMREACYECLNCNILLCLPCRKKHTDHSRFKNHAIIVYQDIDNYQQKVENDRCVFHKELLKLFCLTCNYPLCMLCIEYDIEHQQHEKRTLNRMLDEVSKSKNQFTKDMQSTYIPFIKDTLSQYMNLKQKLIIQRDQTLETLNSQFLKMHQRLKERQIELESKIRSVFEESIRMSEHKIQGFETLESRINYLCDLHVDYDLFEIKMVKIQERASQFLEKSQLNYLQDWDLQESGLQNDPLKKVELCLKKYDFKYVNGKQVAKFKDLFNSSNILKGDQYINRQSVCLFPKFKQASLLYRMTEEGLGTRIFHKQCDNKGPSIMFVKANKNYIFGGFNPQSWMSESLYLECEDAFLFSLSRKNYDGSIDNTPFICQIRSSKIEKAIKLNDENFSPGFGESDISDLFISFKNPRKSYSLLGNVYKLPQGYKGDTFLAGKATDWNVNEIEIYSVSL